MEPAVKPEHDWQKELNLQQRKSISQSLLEFEETTERCGNDFYYEILNYQRLPRLGEGKGLMHVINTDSNDPIWTAPHKLAPAWKEPLREEVISLLRQIVIRPSTGV